MSQTPSNDLFPLRLRQAVVQTPEDSFVQANRHMLYLAVSIAGDLPDLIEGLELISGSSRPARPMSIMAFKTSAGARNISAGSLRPAAAARPLDTLIAGRFHVVEIGKRVDIDGAFPERISVGRAANK